HTFLSMEYVDGEDLASLLRRIGRFPQDRALEIARQVCAGLAAAHERGVVHRDFKPANVMIDGAGKVRVTDFGLAGAAGETIRAGSALAVAASLPGGAPRAAALAAGQTPSPEMVAAAGMADAMSARHVWLGAAWVGLALILVLLAYQRVLLVNRVPIPKPPDAL